MPDLRAHQLVRFNINGIARIGRYLGDIHGRTSWKTRSRARVAYYVDENNRQRSGTVSKRKIQPA